MNWISIEERKPKNDSEVIVFAPNCRVIGSILIGCYYNDTDSWTVYDFGESKLDEPVTHWMPLTEPPTSTIK